MFSLCFMMENKLRCFHDIKFTYVYISVMETKLQHNFYSLWDLMFGLNTLYSVVWSVTVYEWHVSIHFIILIWWRHQMETFSALLALCAGNSPLPGEFPTQRLVTRSFDVFFDLCLNKRLSKQPWGWWFETLSRSLWRHCNGPYSCWIFVRKNKIAAIIFYHFSTLEMAHIENFRHRRQGSIYHTEAIPLLLMTGDARNKSTSGHCINLFLPKYSGLSKSQYGLPHCGRHMARWIWINIGPYNGLLPDGTKTLSEPLLTSRWWGSVTWGQFHNIYLSHQSIKFASQLFS